MRIHQLLEHHGVSRNPFAEEDAQTDPVFKEHCIFSTYHPTWYKIYGNPGDPSTSIVFGEKGAGKTALKLQISQHIGRFNSEHAGQKTFVIQYDDFNPFLDRFRDKLSRRKRRPERMLAEWKLWDHMDAILSLGVTQLVDAVLEERQEAGASPLQIEPNSLKNLERHQSRDLLLLAGYYDQSTSEAFRERWLRLRRRLRHATWKAHADIVLATVWTTAVIVLVAVFAAQGGLPALGPLWIYLLAGLAGWAPWAWRALKRFWLARKIVRRMRVGNREASQLRRVLMQFTSADLSGQPFPSKDRTDDRYELLGKFQGILRTLGYSGIVVLVDRVDEPHLINGSAPLMKALVWPMLDNKFLKHPGLGLKLMLPAELTQFVDREDSDFYQRARLDKQNTILSLGWTGQALYDVASARLQACAANGEAPRFREFFDDSFADEQLIESVRTLRVPRHLFKFMYRLLVAHCNKHLDDQPVWKISRETFAEQLALYQRDQEAFLRGMGAG